MGVTQILAWGSSYYLPAVLADPIVRETGWPLTWVVGGLSLGLLVAALISPRVGKAIERRGGRGVLAFSAAALGVGQLGLSVAPSLPLHIAAWLVIGVGMGAGLYDAAFATLGRLFGHNARASITALTLFGGPWIPERSATRLREADLNVLSKLGKQGLEWRLKPEAFAGREVGRQDDLLDVLVGCAVDIEVARQPST